jgi:hypothetical protein
LLVSGLGYYCLARCHERRGLYYYVFRRIYPLGLTSYSLNHSINTKHVHMLRLSTNTSSATRVKPCGDHRQSSSAFSCCSSSARCCSSLPLAASRALLAKQIATEFVVVGAPDDRVLAETCQSRFLQMNRRENRFGCAWSCGSCLVRLGRAASPISSYQWLPAFPPCNVGATSLAHGCGNHLSLALDSEVSYVWSDYRRQHHHRHHCPCCLSAHSLPSLMGGGQIRIFPQLPLLLEPRRACAWRVSAATDSESPD